MAGRLKHDSVASSATGSAETTRFGGSKAAASFELLLLSASSSSLAMLRRRRFSECDAGEKGDGARGVLGPGEGGPVPSR